MKFAPSTAVRRPSYRLTHGKSLIEFQPELTTANQVAKVTLLDARTSGVTPFEKKMTQAVEKAIRDSDLGLNPATQGETVRVQIPEQWIYRA